VLQVRSLANRGEPATALALLERLLADDPQWQPLRSLREQLQQPSQQAPQQSSQQAPQPQIKPHPKLEATPVPAAPAAQGAAGFEALLERAAARLQALGAGVPAPAAAEPPADLDALAGQLRAFERRLSDYEARFALA
jgi:hypothetical protein